MQTGAGVGANRAALAGVTVALGSGPVAMAPTLTLARSAVGVYTLVIGDKAILTAVQPWGLNWALTDVTVVPTVANAVVTMAISTGTNASDTLTLTFTNAGAAADVDFWLKASLD